MSFKDNDRHILDAIAQSTISKLYISVLGNIEDESNQELKAAMERLKSIREQQIANSRKRTNIEIEYYDAASANIWGNHD